MLKWQGKKKTYVSQPGSARKQPFPRDEQLGSARNKFYIMLNIMGIAYKNY